VTEVVVAERSLRPDPALAARLKAMTGKPFDPRTFIQVIDSLVRELPNGAHGFRFSAERSGDGTGFTLKVDLLDEARAARVHRLGRILHEPPPRKGELHAWHHYTRVTVGGKGRYAGGNGAELPTYWVNKGSAELQHALADLCSTPIDQPIEVCVQLIAEFAK